MKDHKTLLGTIVRRHLKLGEGSGPIGRLIAEERRKLAPTEITTSADLESRLVDRLYRRFFLQREATVDLFASFRAETRLA